MLKEDLSRAISETELTGEKIVTVANLVAPKNRRLNQPENFINREVSHLRFHRRVLSQAEVRSRALLERLKFIAIFSTNLDEFYEIRVATLMKQITFGREVLGADGRPIGDVLAEIGHLAQECVTSQYESFGEDIMPALAREGIELLEQGEWSQEQQRWLWEYFQAEVMPVISPVGLDPTHPFPRLVNKSLNFIVRLEGKDAFGRDSGLAIVPVPISLPTTLKVPRELSGDRDCYVFASSVIEAHLRELFPGMAVKESYEFRITRNSDFEVNEAEVEDIAHAVMGELHSRRFGSAVRLEVSAQCTDDLTEFLLNHFSLSERELFKVSGPVDLGRLWAIYEMVERPDLRDAPFTPGLPVELQDNPNLFDTIKARDILLHHPYEAFSPIVDLIRQAARDPAVVAIKQTLYRIGSNSELIDGLVEAARNGKSVTVIIELRARFDEEENIQLATRLQEAGALVVYGVVAFKTHAKMLLIVRREQDQLIRYAHLGTGNYHTGNARLYTDYSMFTSDPDICREVHNVFQQLTGMGKTFKISKLLHAPFTLKKRVLQLIQNETAAALEGKPARIIAKLNGLTDAKVITALYEASQAGVKIDLIVRSQCCLKPGIEGLSANISVVSIVGRFLEHSRAYYFENGTPQIYLSSADWMERNLNSRVEVCFPIGASKLAARVKRDLEQQLSDTIDGWGLDDAGAYELRCATDAEQASQHKFLARYAQVQVG